MLLFTVRTIGFIWFTTRTIGFICVYNPDYWVYLCLQPGLLGLSVFTAQTIGFISVYSPYYWVYLFTAQTIGFICVYSLDYWFFSGLQPGLLDLSVLTARTIGFICVFIPDFLVYLCLQPGLLGLSVFECVPGRPPRLGVSPPHTAYRHTPLSPGLCSDSERRPHSTTIWKRQFCW